MRRLRVKIAVLLCKLICFCLGHLFVNEDALWVMHRSLLPNSDRVDAVCLRCGRREETIAEVIDNFFMLGPYERKLMERERERERERENKNAQSRE